MDREIDLLKIQIHADYCQANFIFLSSIVVSVFAGLFLVFVALVYQGLMSWYVYYLSIAVVTVFFFIELRRILKEYHNDLDQIQDLLSQVEKNESLPTLKEMRKKQKKKKSAYVEEALCI